MGRLTKGTVVMAAVMAAGISEGGAQTFHRVSASPKPPTLAPARTVTVPPGETVMLTPVYPVHYPAPIYMTPPLYGQYVPGYYIPAAYFQATPLTPVQTGVSAVAAAAPASIPDLTVRRAEAPAGTASRQSTTVQTVRQEQTVQRELSTPEK